MSQAHRCDSMNKGYQDPEVEAGPMAEEKDDLEEFIVECSKEDPNFPAMVEAALRRRQMMRARGEDPNDISVAEEEPEEQSSTPNTRS